MLITIVIAHSPFRFGINGQSPTVFARSDSDAAIVQEKAQHTGSNEHSERIARSRSAKDARFHLETDMLRKNTVRVLTHILYYRQNDSSWIA
ncbi:MAG: hypothetical protein K0Q74_294 [Gammaproteobacteria bacterium]|jgi:hypothetical protein|nr:hypothetical protein [Gammaproteobacteria bacterium]